MKNTILSLAAAFALLTATAASAASIGGQDGPRNGNNSNYGYDKNHQVTPEERAKWEAQHKNDRRDDRNDRRDDKKDHDKNDRHDDKKGHDDKKDHDKDDRRDDKKDHDKNDRGNNGNGRGNGRNDNNRGNNGRDTNYGYDKSHQVTPEERTAWEAQHKNDHR
ncbi:MAG: hypothetical protein ACRYFX_04795 [Janthinobacterium lividum]